MSDGMDEEIWSEKALFIKAVSLPADEQRGFVENSEASIEIRESVLVLLASRQGVPSTFLEPPDSVADYHGLKTIGPYKLVRRIASGGMGVVYEGWDEEKQRQVAIKILAPHLNESDEARGRLRHEAYVVAKLSDSGIVQVYDVVDFEESLAIVSQYIDGGTVADLIAQYQGTTGFIPDLDTAIEQRIVEKQHIPVDRVLHLVRGVASALVHAHQAGVIHRDIKPSNILIDKSTGNPRLIDFGIAKLLTQTEVLHTSAGAGTCHYMSPEQIRDDSSRIGPASDVFSLGIVLYELLTLEHVFNGPTRDMVIQAIQNGIVRPPRDIRSEIGFDLETVCLKALETDVGYRYKTILEFLQDIECVIQGLPVTAKRPSTIRRMKEATKTRRQLILIAGALLLGTGSGLAVMQRVLDDRAKLHILLEIPDAEISIQRLDESTLRYSHALHEFRKSKVVRLEPGLYRISLHSEDGLREFERMFETGQSAELILTQPLPALNRDDMVLIHSPTRDELAEAPDDFVQLMVGMESFLIDKYEVSNAQYFAFANATGHEKPSYWPVPYNEIWDDLPVTSVSYWDAQAYAEWVGKRLPTYQEWQLTARGPQGERYPWGDSEVLTERSSKLGNFGAIDPGVLQSMGDYLFHFESYTGGVSPVNADHYADQRNGVFHLYGNVREWTGSPLAGYPFGSTDADYGQWIICGQAWAEPFQVPVQFVVSDFNNDKPTGLVISRGFRCAISRDDKK